MKVVYIAGPFRGADARANAAMALERAGRIVPDDNDPDHRYPWCVYKLGAEEVTHG